ncbi:hypothetical protein [Pseudoalteromonas sp. OOF1S-7]|uniref:hypothetical protein n=1 Tax=Pseudoalteromonas sp. OOF1S-7 TaxID=2917757 RepID=UPI001EF6E889|nr:hypothetical protein [Pseudoalteromonas sp. OOF1S-7]MCG7536581.1 hypothetical protein [Pseudoalteromonas sp. OOF1S-7]
MKLTLNLNKKKIKNLSSGHRTVNAEMTPKVAGGGDEMPLPTNLFVACTGTFA